MTNGDRKLPSIAVFLLIGIVVLGGVGTWMYTSPLSRSLVDPPLADFSFSYRPSTDNIKITYTNGEELKGSNVYIEVTHNKQTRTFRWSAVQGGNITVGESIILGDAGSEAEVTVRFAFDKGDTIEVIWRKRGQVFQIAKYVISRSSNNTA
ncbi:MAG: hypothetical protein ABEI06_05490 [Halobacteriaceae archaeon]